MKRTTMNILTGYISCTEGQALIDGIDILENPIEAKAHIGYLPEQPPLYHGRCIQNKLHGSFQSARRFPDRSGNGMYEP